MLYFITHRHLILNHQQGIENTGLSLVNDTVCMTDMLDHLFTHPLVGKDYGVDPVVGNRFLSRDDIRRYILTEAATGLCHRPGTDTAALTCQYITSEDRNPIRNGFRYVYRVKYAPLHVGNYHYR